MTRPRAIVLRAPGTNCDEETAAAWQRAGAAAETWHVGRLLESPGALDRFQILTIPGGFSYGDDLGAGRILATRLGDRPGRRPAAVPRPRRPGPGHLQRLPGPGPRRPPARRAVPVRTTLAAQRLRPLRGPLGPALAPARPLAVRHVRRADRAARRPRRGPVS